jgi:hypothetical protein
MTIQHKTQHRICTVCKRALPIAEYQSAHVARRGRLTRSCFKCRASSYDRVRRASALLSAFRTLFKGVA